MDVTQQDVTVFEVAAIGRLIPEDIEFVCREIVRALKRLEWDTVTFHVDVDT